MTRLTESLQCWRSGDFDKKLKHELESLPAGTLPLENALTRCGTVDDSDIAVVVISSREQGGRTAKCGSALTRPLPRRNSGSRPPDPGPGRRPATGDPVYLGDAPGAPLDAQKCHKNSLFSI